MLLVSYNSVIIEHVFILFQPNASSPSKTGTLQTRSVTASQLATDSPAKMNGHYHESTGNFL